MIIHQNNINKLYDEKPLDEFSSIVNVYKKKSFGNYLIKNKFKYNDIFAFKIIKDKKEFEFISKFIKWNRFYIPKYIIESLDIKNHEKINFKIINKAKKLDVKENVFDLAEIPNFDNKIKTIERKDNLLTLYSKQKVPITLPRFIDVSQELVELLFLIHGDGHYQYKLYFVSKTPELHKFVMEQFENILHIPKSLWRYIVLLTDLDFAEKSELYWKNKLNLKEEQFYNCSKAKLNTCKNGNLRIIIDKSIVSVIFRFLFNKIKNNLEERLPFYALNGLLCAEGGAQVGENGLHKITLSFNQNEKELFKDVLIKCGLINLFRIEQDRNFILSGWYNQYVFIEKFLDNNIIPFSYHNSRKHNLLKGFLEHSFTKTLSKYLGVFNNKSLTLKELSQLLKIREDSILSVLRKERYSKFVDFKGKGINRHPYRISINLKGKEFLDFFKEVKRYYETTIRTKAQGITC